MSQQNENLFKITARVERVDVFTTKNGKKIPTVILATDGQYPQVIPVKFFGHVAATTDSLTVGDVIKVSGRLGGREYSGRVYAENIGESFEVVTRAEKQRSLPSGADDVPPLTDDDIGF